MVIYVVAIISLIFFISGYFRLALFLFRMPSIKAHRVAGRVVKVNKGNNLIGLLIQYLSTLISKRIVLSESRKNKITSYLKYSENESMSPQAYEADKIARVLFLLSIGIVLFRLISIAGVAVFILTLVYYFRADSALESVYNKKKQDIEYELPRFCATINQEIKNTTDVIDILERYAKSTDRTLRKELLITIADMKSSNYEAALVRLESRLSIGALSDIARGLIGVIRGDDMKAYFEMLSHDLDALELQRLEDRAAKQPEKIKKYQFLILASMMIMYIAIIALYLLGMDRSMLM